MMWRGDAYVKDPPFLFLSTALTAMTPIELLALNVAILLVVIANHVRCPRRLAWWCALWGNIAASEEIERSMRTVIAFIGAGAITVVGTSVLARMFDYPIVDGLAVGLILGVAFINRGYEVWLQGLTWFKDVCSMRVKGAVVLMISIVIGILIAAEYLAALRLGLVGLMLVVLVSSGLFTIAVIAQGLFLRDAGNKSEASE